MLKFVCPVCKTEKDTNSNSMNNIFQRVVDNRVLVTIEIRQLDNPHDDICDECIESSIDSLFN